MHSYTLFMNIYIEKLNRIGVSASEAYRIVFDFLKNYSVAELEEYIESLEADVYVY